MTDTYKETIRRTAEAVCSQLAAGCPEEVEEIITKNLTHPHSPYECYWRDRALAAEALAEKRLQIINAL